MVVEQFKKAFDATDMQGVVKLFAPDAVFLGTVSPKPKLLGPEPPSACKRCQRLRSSIGLSALCALEHGRYAGLLFRLAFKDGEIRLASTTIVAG